MRALAVVARGWDLVTSRERVRVAHKLGELAAIDDALRRGELSYSKVRALVRIATPANEAMILEHARLTTAAQLEKLRRKYALVQRHGEDRRPQDDVQRRYVRRRDTEDGMVKIEAVLHPEEAELVWAMLDHRAKQVAREHGVLPGSVGDSAEACGPVARSETEGVASAVAAPGRGTAGRSGEAGLVSAVPAPDRGDLGEACLATLARRAAPVPALADEAGFKVASRAMECSPDDSAEAVGAVERGETEAVTSAVPAQERGDLAGSCQCAPARPDVAVPVPADEALSRSASGAMECSPDDSAEAVGAVERGETEAVAPAVSAPDGGDRAEAWLAELAPPEGSVHVPASSAAPKVASRAMECSPDDSAEVRGAQTGAQAIASAISELTTDAAMSTSASDPGPRRSLRDRLLDEAEAASGGAKPATSSEGELGQPTESSTMPGSSQPGRSPNPSVLHQRVHATRRAFDRADALVAVAQAYLRGERPDRAPIDVMITIPASSLRGDAGDPVDVGCIGDSCVSAETARRLSCDAGVIEVIEDDDGVPLSVGRKRRTIAGSIKRTLLKRDTACCYPGCTNRTFLEGHHLRHWADGGLTTLDNAALLCTHHHRYVHEYGYAIELGHDQRPRFRDPRGRLVEAIPARRCGPDVGWPQIHAANAPLGIHAQTIACEWDGRPVDYGRVIGELVVVDQLT